MTPTAAELQRLSESMNREIMDRMREATTKFQTSAEAAETQRRVDAYPALVAALRATVQPQDKFSAIREIEARALLRSLGEQK